jgi:hypothetical protein
MDACTPEHPALRSGVSRTPVAALALLFSAIAAIAAIGCDGGPAAHAPGNAGAMAAEAPPARTTARVPGPASATDRRVEADAAPMRAPRRDELAAYPWLAAATPIRSLEETFAPPAGYRRVPLEAGTHGAWLRRLPLRAPGTEVRTYDGAVLRPAGHPNIAAVAEIDVGPRDLQQCADSIMRLHAEWLWSTERQDEIGYRLTSGGVASWKAYREGTRPRVEGHQIHWEPSRAGASRTRRTFGAYLDFVYGYGGTSSLAAHVPAVARTDVRPGDFFVLGGSPGHAVIVLDVAVDEAGRKVALIGEGFMPAQDFHVIRPDRDRTWYSLEVDALETPFWRPFPWSSLRRLPG